MLYFLSYHTFQVAAKIWPVYGVTVMTNDVMYRCVGSFLYPLNLVIRNLKNKSQRCVSFVYLIPICVHLTLSNLS